MSDIVEDKVITETEEIVEKVPKEVPKEVPEEAIKKNKEQLQFRVSTKSNVHKLSSAIYKTYLEETKFELIAIGAGAINQAIKSLAEARGMLIKSGKDVSFIPFFRDIKSTRTAGGIVSAVVFVLREA